ncbi:23545_t:CDS:2, partial [Gigaspora margarita]
SNNNLFEIIPDNNTVKNVTTTSNSVNIASNVSVSRKSSTRLPSLVRPFFSQKTIDNKSVLCSICKSKFSITTATGNLCKHLDSRHPGWEANKPIPSQQLLTFIPKDTISNQILTPAQKAKFSMLVAEWIVSDTLPFSVVSSQSFATMIRYLNANIDLPSRDVIKSIIQKAFTNILLDICMLPHPHTGEEINAKLCSVFAAFNITDKILCATTDGGANMDFKELGQTVGEGESTHKIPQDVSTHWNNETNLQVTIQFLKPFYETTNVFSGSTYTTLGISILLIDDIVENVSACIQDSTSPEFLKTATIQISEKIQKYTNEIYNKMAFIAAILDPQIKLELMPTDMNNEANRIIFNNIFRSEYAELILNNSSTSLTFSISSTSSTSSTTPTSSTNLKVPLNLTYTEQIAQKRQKASTLTNKPDELTQYLNEAVLSIDVDPLNWWKLNHTYFLYLSQMAKNYLAIQSTSVLSG